MGNQRAVCERKTIAVSATILISVKKVHHQIRLRILSCGRMSENHRGPEVPEGRVPVVEMSRWPCKDYLRETCNNSFCERWHPPECLFYKTKSGCRFGEKCSFAHRQVDQQPTKRSKTNDDKSAVAMLKKENWQERESVSDACHDRTVKLVKRGDEKLGRNSSKRQFSDARQFGLRISGHEARRSLFSGSAQTCRSQSNV